MGIFDSIETGSVSNALGGNSSSLMTALLQMVQNHPGGLQGLLQGFQQKGLGDLVSSWVGTGQNLPISADQVHQALGSEQVQQLAASAGVSTEAAGSQLAGLLPHLVDMLTPNGQLPQQGSNLLDMGMKLLQSLPKTGTEG